MDKSPIDILWVLVAAGLVFMMQAGFLCLEAGLTRAKNAINVAIKNLADAGIAIVLYWLFGFALMFGMTKGGWIGSTHFLTPVGQGGAWLAAFFLFQVVFCATAVTIISGAVAERIRFSAYVIVAIIVSGFVYPLFGHWAWGGAYEGPPGWLAGLGFIDFAGSTVVHSIGGWAALAVLLVIGSRAGRFPEGGVPREIPGSNLPLAILGTLLLWFGWLGFNGGSTLAMNDQVPGIIANTMLAAGAGLVTTLAVGWRVYRYPDPMLPINGSLAGLVAITASCFAVDALSAVIIGGIGGIVMLCVRSLLERWKIDDVVGAIPVHLGAGIWGTLAVALFGKPEILGTGLSRMAQLQIQILGVVICGFIAFGVTHLLLRFINGFFPLRVTPEAERLGLNVTEHRATTEIWDLAKVMEYQAKTQDFSLRAPVEPFTEVGQIATLYNRLVEILEKTKREEEELRVADGKKNEELQRAYIQLSKESKQLVGTHQEVVIKKEELERTQEASLNVMEDLERRRKEVEERERQLKETQAMLVQAGKLAAMGQLGAGIAHELNQPLAAIRGYAQVIMEEMSSGEPHRKDLEMINEQTERMAQIIDNVRIFSRTSEIHLVPLDIHKPIEDALMLLAARLRNHNIEVVQEFRKDLPKVVADSNQLQQVFINLFMNARDVLVPRQGGKIWVKTELQPPALTGRPPDLRSDRIGDGPGGRGRGQAAEKVIVRFRDSGPGIPSNIVKQIFDPFFTTKDAGDGTGLGLSISYGIIKDHKGEIEVVSEEGHGAEFVITLPAAQGKSSGSAGQKDA